MELRSVIKQTMLAEAEDLARLVLPDGKRHGREWRGSGPDGHTWSINLGHDARRGVFSVWSQGKSGDIVRFVTDGLFNGEFLDMRRWAQARYGLGDPQVSSDIIRRLREQASRNAAARRAVEAKRATKRQQEAIAMFWLPGDDRLAPTYLAGRGLPDAPAPYLRSADAVPYDKGGLRDLTLPAMLAPVINLGDARQIGTHRTFLEQGDGGTWQKARRVRGLDDFSAKLSRGPVQGGAIPLLDGAGLPWRAWLTDPHRATEPLLLAEGIENALSAALAHPGVRTATYLSAPNLLHVANHLPREADPITLVVDRDDTSRGRDTIRAQREAALTLWRRQNRRVDVFAPPAGIKDVNDHLLALSRDHDYGPCFQSAPVTFDLQSVLADAVPATAGDAAAVWWESLAHIRWGGDGTPRLALHPSLATIERPDSAWPAAVWPIVNTVGETAGAAVAWLADGTLAPLLRPVRCIGSSDGVIVLRPPRRASQPAVLAVGLPNAFAVLCLRQFKRCAVFAAVDAPCAVAAAGALPPSVGDCALLISNEDVTVGERVFTVAAREALDHGGHPGGTVRPWDGYADFAAMLRDPDLRSLLL